MEISIVVTDEVTLVLDLIGVQEEITEDEKEKAYWGFVEYKKPVEVVPGVQIKYVASLLFEAVGAPEGIVIAVSFASSVAGSLFAAWLYDRLKRNRAMRLKIEAREVEINEGQITRIIETIITTERDKEVRCK